MNLPRFNWGAFLIPPVWGVAHGQWAGVFFLPVWAFVDNVLRGQSAFGGWSRMLGIAMALATIVLQVFFAAKANEVAAHRAGVHFDAAAYLRSERIWAIAGAVMALALVAWIYAYLSRYGTAIVPR